MPKISQERRGVKTGDHIERLEIIGPFFTTNRIRSGPRWMCVVECKCGTIKVAELKHLVSGAIKSCGCLQSENAKKAGYKNKKHGLDSHPLANIWRAMRWRCDKQTGPKAKYYRERGITYCEEWKDLKTFVDWCLSNGWKEGLELDRFPDQNGNYEPGNIRFATRIENMRNTRFNRQITAWGETKCLAEWAEDQRCKVKKCALQSRLSRKSGQQWTPEEAISTPPTRVRGIISPRRKQIY